MRNAKDGERKGYWGKKPIKHLYVDKWWEWRKGNSPESLTGCSWTEFCGEVHEVGRNVLVHSLNKNSR